MFGCIAAGRLVQTNLQQVDVNKYVFELSDPQSINHLVVFLLGTIPFEPGYAATVHLLWPNKDWQLLGGLSNEKPSAIFRIGGGKNNIMMNQPTATLGISIEPIETVQQLLSTLSSGVMKSGGSNLQHAVSMTEVGQMASRVIENLFNYVTSFAVQDLPMNGIALGEVTERGYLPVKAFQTWYNNLSRKLANDPNYLSSEKSA
ncbi:uncharacterized protein BX664DRAFT_361915 [Halteromyces radiatus]|uniref:uncharacterized protein n=1 Tax=Halteromyces radiatus TaxID=101107 RepID=UPI00221E9A0E|nr:uncharacterized protein BX664DRAFT_361915 [Halteromyces radiatus]KAI8079739.1 hypothetical protein BX664DRAFT_361915 [Halteromyces radiatus]